MVKPRCLKGTNYSEGVVVAFADALMVHVNN